MRRAERHRAHRSMRTAGGYRRGMRQILSTPTPATVMAQLTVIFLGVIITITKDMYIYIYISGWWFGTCFSIYWE